MTTMRLSVVVPTYERPEWLRRIVAYLAPHAMRFELWVLDSSSGTTLADARGWLGSFGGRVRHVVYDADIPLRAKLEDGLGRLETPYCVFCADDDLVIPDALERCVTHLDRHTDHVGAQGLYFAHSASGAHFFVDDILYCHRPLDQATALERLAVLFDDYQSNFYAVYRTEAQRAAFAVAARQDNSLFFELLQSAHTAASGKVARLPIVYAGRSRSPSAGSPTHWHPVEWLALDPQSCVNAYLDYRSALMRVLDTRASDVEGRTRTTLDLIHLRYAVDSIRSSGLQAAITARLDGAGQQDVVARAFAAAYSPGGATSPASGAALDLCQRLLAAARRLRRRLAPPRPSAMREVRSRGRVTVEFNPHVAGKLAAFDAGLAGSGLDAIADSLDAYFASSPN